MQLSRLGPYKIERPLGKGGMGSVYEATDVNTGERVAIKALTPHLAMAEGFRERFEAEIESLKTLRHEGIVRLFGYGEQDGILFYSMELVDGVSLEDELKAGRRFNWREVSSIAIQLSLALKHAHDHGIVHRDIKPANILLYTDDRVKLADFGIARLFGTTQLTTAGGVLGTADYMSPEQADGRPVTSRADQYSLGGVMYALSAGRPPFTAKNLPQMLQLQRFAKPEPVRRYAPDTPEQLERIIMQLLEKDPSARFPNTQVLARHLQAMVMALSRPAHDDFALDEHHGGDLRDIDSAHSLASEQTLSEGESSRPANASLPVGNKRAADGHAASHDAATLAADEIAPGDGQPAVHIKAATVDDDAPSISRIGERPARFTTIEEEEARRRAENQRSWFAAIAQFGVFAAVLVAIGALVMQLSKPPSADKLYQSIAVQANGDSDAIASMESEVDEFLRRYPNDRRAGEVRQHETRIELDKIERRLQREARREGQLDRSLSPVERLYLQAIDTVDHAPEAARAMLQSIVDLYGPSDSGKSDKQSAVVVQLAKRRLESLRIDTAKQRKRQLQALRNRLEVADELSKTDPRLGAAMYRAIVNLHGNDGSLAEPVQTARRRLAELENKPENADR